MSIASDQLRRVPLFAGMTDRAFEAVAALAEERAVPAGSVLAVEGEPGDAFFLVLDGTVAISRGGAPLRDMAAGEFLGEIALVDGRTRTATSTATSAVSVAVSERSAFTELMERYPAVRHGILVALTDRIREDETGLIA